MKNVLILCTGNSCRSIMAEALVNAYLGELDIKAYSSGVAPSGEVNPDAIEALQKEGINVEGLHSKTLATLDGINFELVVTVCDHAKETCPMFPGRVKVLHVGFEDPSGKAKEEYTKTLFEIKEGLLVKIKDALGLGA